MRLWNMNPGPSVLPEEVLEQAAAEMMEYDHSGMGPMELSHREEYFDGIIFRCEELLRELLHIPDNYKVLYMTGGATAQFSCVPLNLRRSGKADYILSGVWSELAMNEAKKYMDIAVPASTLENGYKSIPHVSKDMIRQDADYVYICANNTDQGTMFQDENYPECGDVPLVADMTSIIMSQEIDVSRYGVIFAGAQKNLGCTGVTIGIIREDLIKDTDPRVPILYQYKTYSENESMYNTPPTYSIYIHKLHLEWMKRHGGLKKMAEESHIKANKIYDFIDKSSIFTCPIQKPDRSVTNIVFNGKSLALEDKFLDEAQKAGFLGIRGFWRYDRTDKRSVGIRMSLYNAFPMKGVDAFVDFLKDFEAKNA